MPESPDPQGPPRGRSLAELHPSMWDVPVWIVLSAVLLAAGLFLPVVTIRQLIFKTDTFSILSGIQSLWDERQKLLAIVVFVFSIVFPLLKLMGLAGIWYGRFPARARQKILHGFSALGKWSMLDVFVVAVTIVVAKLSAFTDAHARSGIYVFALSVALSIVAGMRVERATRRAH